MAGQLIKILVNYRLKIMNFSRIKAMSQAKPQMFNSAPDQEKLLQTILDSANYAIISTTINGSIVTFNRTAEKLLGYQADEIIGLGELMMLHSPLEISERARELSQELGMVITPGFEVLVTKVRRGEIEEREWTYIRKNGTKFSVFLSITGLYNESRNLTGFLAIARSISKKSAKLKQKPDLTLLRNNSLLTEKLNFIQKIAASSPNIFYVYDLIANHQIYANRNMALMLGYSVAEMQIMGAELFANLMHPEDLARLPNYYQQIEFGLDGDIFEIEYRLRNRNGKWHWFVSRDVIFTRTRTGKVQQILCTATDITENKQVEAELIQRARQSALRSNIGLALTKGSDLPEMLNRCCQALVEYLDAPSAQVWLLNQTENILELKASAGHDADLGNYYSLKIDLIAAERQAYITNNIANDPLISNPEVIKKEGIVAFAGYPLILEEQLVGVIAMSARHCFNSNLRNLLESIASQVAVGIGRKKTALALQSSEARLQMALAGSELGIWDWNILTGEIYFDPQWKKILGYEVTEIEDTFQAWKRLVNPADLAESIKALTAHFEGRTPMYEVEFRMRHKSGEWKWILSQGKVFERDETGKPVRMIGTHQDLSDRYAAQLAKLQLTENLQAAQKIAHIGNWEFDVNTGLFTWSDELFRIFGLTNGQLPTLAEVIQMIHPDDRQGYLRTVLKAMKLGESYQLDCRILGPNESIRYINAKGKAVLNNFNQIVRLFGTIMDITERKTSEIALQKSEQRERAKALQLELILHELKNTQAQLVQNEKMASLGQLVAGIAHEINNPVSFIYGNITYASEYAQELIELIELYQKSQPTPIPKIADRLERIDLNFIKEDFQKLLCSMQQGAERIKTIVLSLRNFSRLDEAEMKESDLHAGIDSTLMILQQRLKQQSRRPEIQVIKNFGNLPLVECYPGLLNQAFMNILNNAIDAIEEKLQSGSFLNPQIYISTEFKPLEKIVIIRIADNGIGISSSVRDRIFDPFFTTKPVGQGTGLGLSISYQIITEKHQGSLNFNSQIAQGTELIIAIPYKHHLSPVS